MLRILYGALLLIPFCRTVVQAQQGCYYPSGSEDFDGIRCNSAAAHSACCAWGDTCFTAGTCFSPFSGKPYRRSCTDRAFKDSSCPKQCLDYKQDNWINIVECKPSDQPDQHWWCCSDKDLECCRNATLRMNDGFTNGNAVLTSLGVPNGGTPTTLGLTSQASRTGAANGAGTTDLSSDGAPVGDSTTTTFTDTSLARTVGLGTGIPLLILLLAAIGVITWLWKRYHKLRSLLKDSEARQTALIVEMEAHERREARTTRAELTGPGRFVVEAPGHEWHELEPGLVAKEKKAESDKNI